MMFCSAPSSLRLVVLISNCLFCYSTFIKDNNVRQISFENEKRTLPTNAVIFLAKPDLKNMNSETGTFSDSGLNYLKFTVKGFLQPCYNNVPGLKNHPVRKFYMRRKKHFCENMLNMNVLAMLNWAQNTLHMTTAVISAGEQTTEDSIHGNYKSSYFRPKEGSNQPKFQPLQPNTANKVDTRKVVHNKEIFGQLPLLPRNNLDYVGLPVLKYESFDDSPLINAYNPDENNMKKYYYKVENEPVLQPKFANDLDPSGDIIHEEILLPEVPEAKVKRFADNIKEEPMIELHSEPLDNGSELKTTRYVWNIYDVFNKIQDTFYDSFFNTKRSAEDNSEENHINTDLLGKVQRNSYFKLVRRTILDLKSEKRSNTVHPGFLMVINAGELSDVGDSFSELVQSVKSVDENTADDTLLVVTGSCPKRPVRNLNIPYYAKGRNSEYLENAQTLPDLFEKIRAALIEVPIKKAIPDELINQKFEFTTDKDKKSFISLTHYPNNYKAWLQDLGNGNVFKSRSRYQRFFVSSSLKRYVEYKFTIISFILYIIYVL